MDMWNSIENLKNSCSNAISIENNSCTIVDAHILRNDVIDRLVWNSTFNKNSGIKSIARWIIWEASQELKCRSSSIHDLYMARVENNWKDMTVPAINVRFMSYDFARTIFKMLKKHDASTCLFEIAKSEMQYTDQKPAEYVSCILGAAIREGWTYPVFIQGDHFQTNAKKFNADPNAEITVLKNLITESIAAGFYNIDIDTSTLVDMSKNGVDEQQRLNYEIASVLTEHIRNCEPKGITVSIGGEIGEVGGHNSTPEELTSFINGYNKSIKNGMTGISKISIQTGTSHGGIPLPDGSIAKVAIDFDVIDELGEMARREFGIGGVVQHGASTLPDSAFDNFPKHQAIEVHLATGFQNTVMDSTAFPSQLKDEMYKWLDTNCQADKKDGMTQEQFYYKARKRAIGQFKREMWSFTDNTKSALMGDIAQKLDMLFTKLGISGKKDIVDKFITSTAVNKPFPTTPTDEIVLEADDNPNAD